MHIFCSINFPQAADPQEAPPQLLRPPAQPRRARVRGRVRPAAAVPPRSRVPRPRAPCAGQQGGYCPCIQYISPLQVPDLTSRCGVRPPGSTQWRVVGGVAAKLHSHPWLAALGYRSQDQVHCNGRGCPNVQQYESFIYNRAGQVLVGGKIQQVSYEILPYFLWTKYFLA